MDLTTLWMSQGVPAIATHSDKRPTRRIIKTCALRPRRQPDSAQRTSVSAHRSEVDVGVVGPMYKPKGENACSRVSESGVNRRGPSADILRLARGYRNSHDSVGKRGKARLFDAPRAQTAILAGPHNGDAQTMYPNEVPIADGKRWSDLPSSPLVSACSLQYHPTCSDAFLLTGQPARRACDTEYSYQAYSVLAALEANDGYLPGISTVSASRLPLAIAGAKAHLDARLPASLHHHRERQCRCARRPNTAKHSAEQRIQSRDSAKARHTATAVGRLGRQTKPRHHTDGPAGVRIQVGA